VWGWTEERGGSDDGGEALGGRRRVDKEGWPDAGSLGRWRRLGFADGGERMRTGWMGERIRWKDNEKKK